MSRTIIPIRLAANSNNLTTIQVYAPTSEYTGEEIEELYELFKYIITSIFKHMV